MLYLIFFYNNEKYNRASFVDSNTLLHLTKVQKYNGEFSFYQKKIFFLKNNAVA
jgi:hypothetical protein